MRVKGPWMDELDKNTESNYHMLRNAMRRAGVFLPDWKDLPEDTREEFFDEEARQTRRIGQRNMLDLRSFSHEVYAANRVLTMDGETYTSYTFYLPRHSGIHACFMKGRKRDLLKPLDRIRVDWIQTEPIQELRVVLYSKDYSQVTIRGTEEIIQAEDLKFLYELLQETAEYERYFGAKTPYF